MTHDDTPTPLTLDDLAARIASQPGSGLAAATLREIAAAEPGRSVAIGARQLALLVRWAAMTEHAPLFLARDLLDAEEEK